MCLIGCRLDSIGAGTGEWRNFVNTVMELLGSMKYMEFLDYLATNCQFLEQGFFIQNQLRLVIANQSCSTNRSHSKTGRCRLSCFFFQFIADLIKFWSLRPISANAIIFWLSFVVLVFLTLIFPSADNKVPVQPKPVYVCVCVCVCVQEILNTKFNENPLLVSRIMC